MTNKLVISGRIVKELELKETVNGNVLPFDVAVQREFKNKNGEYDADFVSCLATKGTADFLMRHAKKGYFVSLTGRIQNNNFQRDDGTTNYGMQMRVRSVDSQTLFLNKNENNNNASPNTPNQSTIQRGQPQNDWQRQNQSQNQFVPPKENPYVNNNMPVDISDDDLPF